MTTPAPNAQSDSHATANVDGRLSVHIGHSPDPDDAFMWYPLANFPNGSGPGGKSYSPTIDTQPVGSTVCDGGSVDLSVAASSTLALSYQWRLDGVVLVPRQPGSAVVADGGEEHREDRQEDQQREGARRQSA